MPPKKLLIADDSLTIQKVIRLALSGAAASSSGSPEGYDIQAVSDGNDAVQQISLFRPHIVLIDVSLPGKTAVEVKRSVNQHNDLDDIRFVLMSSAFEKVDEHEVQDAGFHGRLTKPFDPAHLRETLVQVLSQVPERQAAAAPHEPTLSIQLAKLQQQPPVPPPSSPPGLPPGLPPKSSMSDEQGTDSDIKHLTESTIRMSGLADAPPPLPTVELQDTPPAFHPQEAENDFGWNVQEPSRRESKADTLVLDFGNAAVPPKDFPITPPPVMAPPTAPHVSHAAAHASHSAMVPPSIQLKQEHHEQESPLMSAATIEKTVHELVHSELEKALKKLAHEAFPELAEKVIKEEIRRLLNEGPQ